jgi:hypothetical protein
MTDRYTSLGLTQLDSYQYLNSYPPNVIDFWRPSPLLYAPSGRKALAITKRMLFQKFMDTIEVDMQTLTSSWAENVHLCISGGKSELARVPSKYYLMTLMTARSI